MPVPNSLELPLCLWGSPSCMSPTDSNGFPLTKTVSPDCLSLCIAEFLDDMILRDSLGIVPSNLTGSGILLDSTWITSFKDIFSQVGVFLLLRLVYLRKVRFFGWVSIIIFKSSVSTWNWVKSFHSISIFAFTLPSPEA